MRLPRGAHVSPVKQQPVVGVRNIFRRDMLDEFLLYFIGRVGTFRHKSQPMSHTIYMGVDSKC